jgi:peptidyl-prolyl cis-trans isomerase A (cyclophilin A)
MKLRLLSVLILFLTAFSVHAQDTITTISGLKYVVESKGQGVKPLKGQKVKVNYTGRLSNGKVFDSTKEGPFKFTLGAKEVIPGWDEGFMLMHEGEKGVLIIPSKLAYGVNGVPDEENPGKYIIPPNADLTFDVELISIK